MYTIHDYLDDLVEEEWDDASPNECWYCGTKGEHVHYYCCWECHDRRVGAKPNREDTEKENM
jgi:hypothetical protein